MINNPRDLVRDADSRYALGNVDCSDWEEAILFGGIAMDALTFEALASAAFDCTDAKATIYEMESSDVDFLPIKFHLDYKSFLSLRRHMMAHFDLLIVPPSKRWLAYLTSDLETFVYGCPKFLSKIRNASGVILGDESSN